MSICKALEVNIQIRRAFVYMRQMILSHKDLQEKLDLMEDKFDRQFEDVYQALNFLIEKQNKQTEQAERKRIGF